jgi:hypothetical protein
MAVLKRHEVQMLRNTALQPMQLTGALFGHICKRSFEGHRGAAYDSQ